MRVAQKMKIKPYWVIKKYKDEESYIAGKPYEIAEQTKNAIVNVGANLLWSLVGGGTGTTFSSSNAYIGVGDGTDDVLSSDTDLVGTNTYRKAMDTGYPEFGTDRKISFQATLSEGQGSFTWAEAGVFNGSGATATMLNRLKLVEPQGPKTAEEIWTIGVTLTIS